MLQQRAELKGRRWAVMEARKEFRTGGEEQERTEILGQEGTPAHVVLTLLV